MARSSRRGVIRAHPDRVLGDPPVRRLAQRRTWTTTVAEPNGIHPGTPAIATCRLSSRWLRGFSMCRREPSRTIFLLRRGVGRRLRRARLGPPLSRLATLTRSSPSRASPELFVFGLVCHTRGYERRARNSASTARACPSTGDGHRAQSPIARSTRWSMRALSPPQPGAGATAEEKFRSIVAAIPSRAAAGDGR